MTQNGPQPLEVRPSRIDYEHYLSKQIQPIAVDLVATAGNSPCLHLPSKSCSNDKTGKPWHSANLNKSVLPK